MSKRRLAIWMMVSVLVAACDDASETSTSSDLKSSDSVIGSDAVLDADTSVQPDLVDDTGAPDAAEPDGALTDAPTDAPIVTRPTQRDARYCEVIPVRINGANIEAEVFTTFSLNDCPASEWDALDPQSLAADFGAVEVFLNGPRYFLMNEIGSRVPSMPRIETIGGIQMVLAATFSFPVANAGSIPYLERQIDRETIFVFTAGEEVYELVSPDGAEYVMQSYAQIVDPTLTIDQLAGLGGRLAVPAGWTYRVRTLAEDLRVETAGQGATVVQDDLSNTYQLHSR